MITAEQRNQMERMGFEEDSEADWARCRKGAWIIAPKSHARYTLQGPWFTRRHETKWEVRVVEDTIHRQLFDTLEAAAVYVLLEQAQ